MITLTDHQMAFVQGLLVFILANVGTSIGQVPLIVNGTLNVSYLILTLLPAIGTAALVYTRSHPQEADAALQDTLAALQTYLAALQSQGTPKGPLVVVHTAPPELSPSESVQPREAQAALSQIGTGAIPNPLAGYEEETQALRAIQNG